MSEVEEEEEWSSCDYFEQKRKEREDEEGFAVKASGQCVDDRRLGKRSVSGKAPPPSFLLLPS